MDRYMIQSLIMTAVMVVFVAWRSGQLGYSRFLWGLTALLASPVFAICLLSSLPNRSSEKARRRELELLENQLRTAGIKPVAGLGGIPRRTISDERTVPPSSGLG